MKEHRGRFQAQGRNLEESEKWACDSPFTVEEGKELLRKLKDKLSFSDRTLRAKAFDDCEDFIDHLSQNGGWSVNSNGKPLKKSFVVYGQERVDLEIQAGTAFKS